MPTSPTERSLQPGGGLPTRASEGVSRAGFGSPARALSGAPNLRRQARGHRDRVRPEASSRRRMQMIRATTASNPVDPRRKRRTLPHRAATPSFSGHRNSRHRAAVHHDPMEPSVVGRLPPPFGRDHGRFGKRGSHRRLRTDAESAGRPGRSSTESHFPPATVFGCGPGGPLMVPTTGRPSSRAAADYRGLLGEVANGLGFRMAALRFLRRSQPPASGPKTPFSAAASDLLCCPGAMEDGRVAASDNGGLLSEVASGTGCSGRSAPQFLGRSQLPPATVIGCGPVGRAETNLSEHIGRRFG